MDSPLSTGSLPYRLPKTALYSGGELLIWCDMEEGRRVLRLWATHPPPSAFKRSDKASESTETDFE